MDLVVNSRRMPMPGETVSGHTFSTVPGGKGANQAVAAARLGCDVTMIGCVGDDEFGRVLKRGLANEGIDTRTVKSVAGMASGVALIQVDENGENAITVVAGANGELVLSEIPGAEAAIQDADVVLMQLEIPLSAVADAVKCCSTTNTLCVLDPAPVPEGEIPEGLYWVDVLSPNQHEAEGLTGVPVHDAVSALQAAHVLQRRGANHVVVKMGAAGAFALDQRGASYIVPPFSANVVDTTAAGDAFTAALGVGLAQQMRLAEATRFGCAAGSLAVQRAGAQEAMPVLKDVMRKLR